jgi:peptidoglycan/LPS O-acetylase OafA/YrhL
MPHFKYGSIAVAVGVAAIVLVILYASISKIWNDNSG